MFRVTSTVKRCSFQSVAYAGHNREIFSVDHVLRRYLYTIHSRAIPNAGNEKSPAIVTSSVFCRCYHNKSWDDNNWNDNPSRGKQSRSSAEFSSQERRVRQRGYNFQDMQRRLTRKYQISHLQEPNNKYARASRSASHESPAEESADYYTAYSPEQDVVVESSTDLNETEIGDLYDFRAIDKDKVKVSEFVIDAPFGSIRVDNFNGPEAERPRLSDAPSDVVELSKLGLPWGEFPPETDQQMKSRKIKTEVTERKVTVKGQLDHRAPPPLTPEAGVTENFNCSQNYFDEQFFQITTTSEADISKPIEQTLKDTEKTLTDPQNIFEGQFSPIVTTSETSSSQESSLPIEPEPKNAERKPGSPGNIFEEQFFPQSTEVETSLHISDAPIPSKASKICVSSGSAEEDLFAVKYEKSEPSLCDPLKHPVKWSQAEQNVSSAMQQPQPSKFNTPVIEKCPKEILKSTPTGFSNFFDDQYFATNSQPAYVNKTDQPNFSHEEKSNTVEPFQLAPSRDQKPDEFHQPKTIREKKSRASVNLQRPNSAFEAAKKLRSEASKSKYKMSTQISQKWGGKIDSHGFRILQDQVTNLKYMTTESVVDILKDSILYQDDNVLAIDKPYGLPSHGGPGVHHSIGGLLDRLARKIDPRGSFTLFLSHRLDKETTGVMLLPKNQEYYVRIREMFKKREVIKKYWMITKGIPNPPEGVIDIPMGEGQVGRYARMTLFPSYDESRKLLFKTGEGRNAGKRSRKDKWDAVTYYRVLDSNNSTALVECQPETGIKHQIRCHMAFALNCAILGDHKYSHFSKMAPQKLYPEILQKLGIRQSKVRHLPMHLHARAIVLPNFKDGRNLFISARLPQHFSQNMKWLKLKAPDK